MALPSPGPGMPNPLRPYLLAGATLALGLLGAWHAHATGILELTGAPTSNHGLTARTLGRHAEVTYFNPALLSGLDASTEFSYFGLYTRGDIRLDPRPPGSDVPPSIYRAEMRRPDGSPERLALKPLPTSALPEARANTVLRETTSYLLLGLVRPLFGDLLTLGVLGSLPTKGLLAQQGYFVDEREQYFSNQLHFELLGDRSELTSFSVALGMRPLQWLAVGAGLNVALHTTTRTDVYVPDAADQRTVLLAPRVSTSTALLPYFGLASEPLPELRLTATLHLPTSFQTAGENRLRFWNYTYPDNQLFVRQTYHFTQGYQPLRASVGAAWLGRTRTSQPGAWELGTTITLVRWATYRDRNGEHPPDRWRDTLSPAIGAGVTLNHTAHVAGDLAFVPSPVPPQTGRTNYVENSRLAASLGYEVSLELVKTQLGVGAYLHGQWLLPRTVHKSPAAPHPVVDELPDGSTDVITRAPLPEAQGLQTNNPGYPGYRSSGWLVGAGLAVRVLD
jgi:long-chain fatty acid transport protein